MKSIVLIFLCLTSLAAIHSSDFKPRHFPTPFYTINHSKSEILLGRALFYDPLLSADQTISCASCHSPYNAFAHTDHRLSHGINDSVGIRNAPALFNLAWQENLMWDGAAHHIEVQPLAPITDQKEMGESLDRVIQKLQTSSLYPRLFKDAYGTDSISVEKFLKALSSFQLTLISANSKYDQVELGRDTFTAQEQSGYEVFSKNCSSCHTEPLFTNNQFENNGLKLDSSLNDYGRVKVTGLRKDSLKFKVPSLRNLSYTYPYMHDGRFRRLREVITHYTKGIKQTTHLSHELKTGIEIENKKQTDLIAFLLTLNDETFIRNKDNKYPFNILQTNQ